MDEIFWENVCAFEALYLVAFGFHLMLLLLLAYSYPFIVPGTGAYVAWTISSVLIVSSSILLGYLLYRCKEHR